MSLLYWDVLSVRLFFFLHRTLSYCAKHWTVNSGHENNSPTTQVLRARQQGCHTLRFAADFSQYVEDPWPVYLLDDFITKFNIPTQKQLHVIISSKSLKLLSDHVSTQIDWYIPYSGITPDQLCQKDLSIPLPKDSHPIQPVPPSTTYGFRCYIYLRWFLAPQGTLYLT